MSETPSFLKTREVLDATGITHQILYRYVTMGLVREYETRESGHRLFAPETIPAINLIRKLNQSGYTLRDIKEIFFKDRRIEQLRKRVERRVGTPPDRSGRRTRGTVRRGGSPSPSSARGSR